MRKCFSSLSRRFQSLNFLDGLLLLIWPSIFFWVRNYNKNHSTEKIENREAIFSILKKKSWKKSWKSYKMDSFTFRLNAIPKRMKRDGVINVTLCENAIDFIFMLMYLLIWSQCGVKSGWGKLNESNFTWIEFIFAFRWTFYIRVSQWK